MMILKAERKQIIIYKSNFYRAYNRYMPDKDYIFKF